VYVQYSQLSKEGDVVAMSGDYKAGTPKPWIAQITIGGTGNGGTNYTGSQSNNDNFTACLVTTNSNQRFTTQAETAASTLIASNALLVYPNPASSAVTLSFVPQTTGVLSLQVYGANGAQVETIYHGLADANKVYTKTINTQKWAKGVYVVQLRLNDQIINRKLVITR
jgi:hypothetical protein